MVFASSKLKTWNVSSVPDMVKWMEQKGYAYEAAYLRTVHGWRRACDERGLSDLECSQLNDDFLDYILDDLMPWHRDEGFRDFSLLEVNWCVCVCVCVCVCAYVYVVWVEKIRKRSARV